MTWITTTLEADTVGTPVTVEVCNDRHSWDAYVTSNPDSSNYHRWGWRNAIQETFGHRPYYLAAVNTGRVKGVLPLFHLKTFFFGNPLVSIPFFSYGGVIADDHDVRELLLRKAVELGRDLKASHVELRQGQPQQFDWVDAAAKVTMELDLPDAPEALWNSLSSGMRNKIRNAKRNNFRVEWGGIESVPAFYRVFSTNMRNLGTPVYSQRWFLNLCRQFPAEVRILTLWEGREALASGLVTCYGRTLELPWSATLAESRKKYSAIFLYWTLLEWAITNGFKKVDFGRCTRNGGVYEFKRHWGSKERPLHWYYWLPSGNTVPELRPDNPRYELATRIWKRLPLPVANFLGPQIVRSIP
jgi:serine/alanine adding enzyme